MIPAIIGGAASLLGTIGSITGARETNAANVDMARETNAMNMAEASRNRDFQAEQTAAQQAFQERMSNTAWQREVADMRKAGVNPSVMKGGGASSPSGGASSGSAGTAQAATQINPFAGMNSLATTALDIVGRMDAMETSKAQRDLIKAQTGSLGKADVVSDLYKEAYDVVKPVIRKSKELINDAPKFFDKTKKKTEEAAKQFFSMPNFFGGMR